jgi:hypothetical protein
MAFCTGPAGRRGVHVRSLHVAGALPQTQRLFNTLVNLPAAFQLRALS